MKKRRQRFVCILVTLVFSLSTWSALFGNSVQKDMDQWRKLMNDEYNVNLVVVNETTLQLGAVSNQTSSSRLKQSKKTRKKPLCVLHVGPSKTGTSTIQWFAAHHEQLLQQDNLYYLGHFKNSSRPEWNVHLLSDLCYSCKQEECANACQEKWKELNDVVNHHYSLGHNIFVSNEMFSGFRPERFEQEHLWNHLVPILKNWDVRIVIAYRRYFEWIPSKYFQLYNPNAQKKGSKWPDKGGRVTPAFSSYFESHQRDTFKHPVELKRKWKKHFPDNKVWIFNMHGGNKGDSLVAHFFCRMIPEAARTCSFVQRIQKGAHNHTESKISGIITINPSNTKLLHFDMLAVGAYKRGWIVQNRTNATRKDNVPSRTRVWEAAQEFSKRRGWFQLTDFPMQCLSEIQTQTFLNQSLQMEKEFLPGFFDSPEGKAELKRDFMAAADQGKFCSIDIDQVLNQEKWKRFFQTKFLRRTGSGNQSRIG